MKSSNFCSVQSSVVSGDFIFFISHFTNINKRIKNFFDIILRIFSFIASNTNNKIYILLFVLLAINEKILKMISKKFFILLLIFVKCEMKKIKSPETTLD